jgi:energy-converting hydrogenase Eha subunit A
MIIKFFDKLHYKLSLSESQINDIIRSRSKCGPSIKGNEFSYDVNFTDKGFKMKFVQSVNFGGIYRLSPIFSGKIEEDCGYSDLTIRMFPNPIMAVGLAIFLYFFLIGIHFISVAGILGFPTIIVAILTLFLCVIIKITNTQFKNMKSILDELFRYYQI